MSWRKFWVEISILLLISVLFGMIFSSIASSTSIAAMAIYSMSGVIYLSAGEIPSLAAAVICDHLGTRKIPTGAIRSVAALIGITILSLMLPIWGEIGFFTGLVILIAWLGCLISMLFSFRFVKK